VIIMGIGMLFGMSWRGALALGLLLSQGGEFGFVLFAQAQNAMLIAPEAASLFGAIVTLSMATTPFLMMLTAKHAHRARNRGGRAKGRATAQRDLSSAMAASARRWRRC
jgi:Kef-type K+ transport system membrane component KefB